MTICTQHRAHLFGRIEDGGMHLTPSGRMVQEIWGEIPAFYPDVEIDAFIVMPNHVHGIIVLPSTERDLSPTSSVLSGNPVGAPPCGRPLPPQNPVVDANRGCAMTSTNIHVAPDLRVGQQGHPQGGAPTDPSTRLSLMDVVERYKSLTTRRYGEGVRNDAWPLYPGKLWQRGYYERVVRNETELARFRNYIESNPARWFEDLYRSE